MRRRYVCLGRESGWCQKIHESPTTALKCWKRFRDIKFPALHWQPWRMDRKIYRLGCKAMPTGARFQFIIESLPRVTDTRQRRVMEPLHELSHEEIRGLPRGSFL